MEGVIKFKDKNLREAFKILKEIDKDLYNQIDKATDEINKNVFCGRNVKKKLIPKEFYRKYGIDNLWIYNLRSGWRLLYSVSSPDKFEILAVVLDWMNHKDYERLFNF
jgi:mRNA-degrading endonuclease RelE of RelBE toxin-antitoxin system